MDNRQNREHETRENQKQVRKWQRPETLPTPYPIAGYGFRWIRVSTLGSADASNVSSKLREGYEACKAKDHQEISMTVIENERFKDNIVIGGLMLCKAPVEMLEERARYYAGQTEGNMQSVDNNLMRESDARMPIQKPNRKSQVAFGNGQ